MVQRWQPYIQKLCPTGSRYEERLKPRRGGIMYLPASTSSNFCDKNMPLLDGNTKTEYKIWLKQAFPILQRRLVEFVFKCFHKIGSGVETGSICYFSNCPIGSA